VIEPEPGQLLLELIGRIEIAQQRPCCCLPSQIG
jgi:hypothetical protein